MKKILPVLVVLLSGCAAPVWVGIHSVNDWQDCSLQGARDFPPALHSTQVGVGYMSPTYTTCQTTGNTTQCKTSGGHYTPPATVTHDANQDARNRFVHRCMVERGNRFMSGKEYEAFRQSYPNDTTPVQRAY